MQNLIVTLITPPSTPLDEILINRAIQALERADGHIENFTFLARDKACELLVNGITAADARAALAKKIVDVPCDIAVQTASADRRKKLLISDMDSTIIEQECIDEMADVLGIKASVADITERAMRGELEFQAALRERVLLLKGLPEAKLNEVFQTRITLSPGARTLVQTMRKNGAQCVLVSGGFTFFTDRVAEAAGFHLNEANILEMEGGVLTGKVREPILDKHSKKEALQRFVQKLGISPADVLALGDGANDIPMLEAAGMGVAYRAKPVTQAAVPFHITHTDLTSALFMQGIKEDEFVR